MPAKYSTTRKNADTSSVEDKIRKAQARRKSPSSKTDNTVYLYAAGLAVFAMLVFYLMPAGPVINELGVREVNDGDFASATSSASMVMFYAPWCGHCKKVKPVYAETALASAEERSNTNFVMCDCAGKCGKICPNYGVKGYPSFHLVHGSKSAEFHGGRDKAGFLKGAAEGIDAMIKTADEKKAKEEAEEAARLKAEAESNVKVLTDEDYLAESFGESLKLVKFYAPWCGHCKALAPKWDAMADDTELAAAGITVAKADCTGKAQQFCGDFKVGSYPKIYLIHGKAKVEYDGAREQADITEWALGGIKKARIAKKKKLAEEKEEKRLRELEEAASPVTYLTSADFNKKNFKKKPHLVKFYAPWCGHCKALAPTWEQLAEDEEIKVAGVTMAKADCTGKAQSACQTHGVKGYPVIKYIHGEDELTFELAERSFNDIKSLVLLPNTSDMAEEIARRTEEKERQEEEAKKKQAEEDAKAKWVKLTDDNWEEATEAAPHFVKFYAPWCGHCKALAPKWTDLAEQETGDVVIAKADCTAGAREFCNKFDVKGYPTLLMVHAGRHIKYEGPRELSDLSSFVAAGWDVEKAEPEATSA